MAVGQRVFSLARMTVSSSGTGTITLNTAVSGFLTFDQAGCSTAATGQVVIYSINDGTQAEIASGTYRSSALTITRGSSTSGLISTNSNSPINMSNTAQVYITPAAYSFTPPTVQVLTSTGSGTYGAPNNVAWLKITCVGAAGGGGGSGTSGASSGGTGANTTFSTLTGGGGTGGAAFGNQGGGGTASGGNIGNFTGNAGEPLGYINSSAATGGFGGNGGGSIFGGAGSGGAIGAAGSSGSAPGAGGGGAGLADASGRAGAGGGAGGVAFHFITSPSSSYSYSVGVGGTAGSAGVSGFGGGAGADGVVIVEEHYGA